MKEKFSFKRKYIKASARSKSKYSWNKVIKDFYDVLKNVPVQKREPWYIQQDDICEDECHNLYEQMQFLLEYKYDGGYNTGFVGFMLPYTTMYFIMKDFSDDKLSYLYITGMEYIGACDEYSESPNKLLNPEYTHNIKRSRVIEVVSALLTQKVILVENDAEDSFFNYFSLEEYEEIEYEEKCWRESV